VRTSLGDFVRSLAVLGVETPEGARATARLFRLSLDRPEAVEATKRPSSRQGERPELEPEPKGRQRSSTTDSASISQGPARLRSVLRLVDLYRPSRPVWLGEVRSLATVAPPVTTRPPSLEPLFPAHRVRGILAAILTSKRRVGELDIERLVTDTVNGNPSPGLPRRAVRTLAGGVQLMVDVGAGMLPFRSDVRMLRSSIERLVGNAALDIVRFRGSPFRSARGAQAILSEYRQHHTPPAGTRVVCLTDLGLSNSSESAASPSEWLSFADWVGRAGARLLAITPFSRSRLPVVLRRAFPIIHWDRRTSAAMAARLASESEDST
jgi:hypothetical protein